MSNPRAKPIVARDQVNLGFARCWQLAVTGMSYRLFRSLVTTAILALAAAFLVHMLGFGLIENETQRAAFEQTQSKRRLGQDISRLSKPDSDRAILSAFVHAEVSRADALREGEYGFWAKLDPSELTSARTTAKLLAQAADYFANLATAPKAVIVGDRSSEELFDYLAIPANFLAFQNHLRQFALRPPLSEASAFCTLLNEQRPKLLEFIGRIRSGQQQAIERTVASIGLPNQALLEQPLDQLANALRTVGFAIDVQRLDQMREFALRTRDQKTIEQMLVQPEVVGAVARRVSAVPKDVNFERLTSWIDSSSDARWLHAMLLDAGAKNLPEPGQIERLFAEYRRERQLSRIADEQPEKTQGTLWGLSLRSQWLIALSFIVCMVGVANAMLMSVTERFTEIATMKCLGAIDRFVMTMFVLEALIQGAVGGTVGLLLGILLAITRGLFEFGPLLALASGATPTVLMAMLLSLGATLVLAGLSAVGPAYVAARLSPMEAMRVE